MAGEYEPVPLDLQALRAVQAFRAEHGRQWRAKLRALWASGEDVGPLRLARNIWGPSGLDHFHDTPEQAAAAAAPPAGWEVADTSSDREAILEDHERRRTAPNLQPPDC
jgi:hypothetical protein